KIVVGWAVPPDRMLEFPCAPTVKDLLKDPLVKNALNQAWSDSQTGTKNYHEEGGWIYANNNNNSLTIIRAAPGTSNSMPSMRTDMTPMVLGSRLVAWFHTHPRGTPSPSEADKRVTKALGVPGITKYNRNGTFTIGPNRRPCFESG
ncbi:MAG: Mov34/MPN/PAD-1 family protein, partial [Pyrinomonadaceae bacterium]